MFALVLSTLHKLRGPHNDIVPNNKTVPDGSLFLMWFFRMGPDKIIIDYEEGRHHKS